MSEYERVKAWRESKRKACPGDCGRTIAWNSNFCRPCAQVEKRRVSESRTVAEVKAEAKAKGKNWTNVVRHFARARWGNKLVSCQECGYDRHVEIAHIQDIYTFSDNTPIWVINERANVMGLCPLHHWEFDNGYQVCGIVVLNKSSLDKVCSKIVFL